MGGGAVSVTESKVVRRCSFIVFADLGTEMNRLDWSQSTRCFSFDLSERDPEEKMDEELIVTTTFYWRDVAKLQCLAPFISLLLFLSSFYLFQTRRGRGNIYLISSHRLRLLPDMCTIQIKIRTMLLVFHNSTARVRCYFFSTTSCLTLNFSPS